MLETASTSHKGRPRSIRNRVIATFVAVIVVFVAAGITAGYRYLHRYEHGITDQMAQASTAACEAFFEAMARDADGDISYDAEEYASWRESLRGLCISSGMSHMYAFQWNPQDNTATYIMYVAADDEADEQAAGELGFGAVVPMAPSEHLSRTFAGEVVAIAQDSSSEEGDDLSWYRKVNGWDDVIAGVDYSIAAQRDRVTSNVAFVVVPTVAALIVLLALQLLILDRSIFAPLGMLAERVRSFSPDRASEFKSIGISEKNELGEIASAFEGMAANIDAYLDDIEIMTAERVQADVELDVARHIQLGLVPANAALCGNGFEVAALACSARDVGGDFYDILTLEDGSVAVAVGDVSGKGIAAALFMSVVKTMIHDGLLSGRNPADVLRGANKRACDSNPEGMFVTVFACVLDSESGTVRYANAGHMPPMLIDDGVRVLDVEPGELLGLFEDANVAEGVLALERGHALLVYTDGVTEAVNAERAFLGQDAFTEQIAARAPYESAAGVLDAVKRVVDGFVGECAQFDDLTAVALMRNAEDMTAVACDMASFAALRNTLLGLDIDDALKKKTCLVCEEMFSNIVMHSGASSIRYRVRADGDAVRIVLEDDGACFDPTAAEPIDKDFDELDTGGMGVALVRQLVSSMAYRREGDRNVLELTVR